MLVEMKGRGTLVWFTMLKGVKVFQGAFLFFFVYSVPVNVFP
jgi:hypothetical protein